MLEAAPYAGLFLSAFLAATILPMQSEAVLVGLLLTKHSPVALVAIASVGNVLGSIVNWMLGRGIERFRDRSWFPIDQHSFDRAQAWYQKYGKWSLLLSWAPIIGDPLTLMAGVLRERLSIFVLLVSIAKTARYVALAALTLNLS
jgi:membrane protein YqaA with SNARE-associated domain